MVNSAAITKDGDPDWEEILASQNFAHPDETYERFQSIDEIDSAVANSEPVPFTSLQPIATDPLQLKQSWQSNDIAKRRQWLTLVTIAVTGSLLAIGCFVAFMKLVGTTPKANQVSQLPIKPAESEPKKTEPVEPVPNKEASPAEPTIKPEDAQATPPQENPEVTPEEPTTPTEPSPTPVNESPVDAAPKNEANNSPAPPKASLFSDDANVNDALPAGLRNLGEMFQQGNSLPEIGKNESSNELDIQNAEVVIADVFHPTPLKIPSWDEKSKLILPSIKIDDTNLLRCIDMFGKITGVGITVDWQSCRLAGIDVTRKIQLEGKEKSIHDVVMQLVANHGLEWSLDNEGLPIIKAPEAAMNAKLPVDWSVAELFPVGSEQLGCETLIRLWGLDDVARYVDGHIEWTERASPIEKANLLSSLYELAVIRQIENSERWQVKPDTATTFIPSQWHGSIPATLRTINLSVIASEARPITDLLMSAAAETDSHLFIDWQHAWYHGLTPTKTAVSVLRGRTFPQVARRFLTDYSLELIPIAENAFWITTGDVRRKMVRVLPVRLPKNAKLDDLKQSLRMLAPLGPDDRSRYRIEPLAGSDDLFWARVSSPNVEQLTDPDLSYGLGWPTDAAQ